MPDRFIASRIRDLPLFERLTDPQIDLLSDAFQAIRYEPGMLAFRQGQIAQGLMLIVSGRGVFTRYTPQGVEQQVGEIGAGEYINESALFNEQYESASLRVVESMVILLLSRGRFAQFLSGKPEIRANLRVPPEWGGNAPISASAQSQTLNPQAVYTPPTPPAMPTQAPAPSVRMPPSMPVNNPRATGSVPSVPIQTAAPPYATSAANRVTQAAPMQPTSAPVGVRTSPERLFKGQRDDETVLHVFKRHWWAFARFGWIAVILIIVGVIIGLNTAATSALLALGIIGASVIVGGAFMAYLYFEWRDDMAVVTDQRLVRIWNYLLRMENTISDVPLDRILEVNVEIPPTDPFSRIFNYGTVIVKTAGQSGAIELDMIPRPTALQTAIFTQRDRYREVSAARQRAQVQADIQRALGQMPANAQSASSGIMDPKLRNARGFLLARTRFIDDDGNIVYRKHFTVWFGHIVIPLIITLVGLGLAVFGTLSPDSILRGGVGLGLSAFVFIVGGIWLYLADWDWRNDLFIIGDQTLTLIHKRPFWLQNQVDQIRLSQIDNVVSDVRGFVDNLLNRGVVRVYLIGADERHGKILGPLFDPQELGAELSRRQQLVKSERERVEASKNRQVITDYLAEYHNVINQTPAGQQPAQTAPPAQAAPRPPAAPPPVTPRDGIRPPNIPRARRDSELE